MKKEIIDRFFQGEATISEIRRIVEYLNSDKIDEDLQKVIEEEFEKKEPLLFFDSKDSFEKLVEKIPFTPKRNVKKNSQKKLWNTLKVAASISLISVVTFLLFNILELTDLKNKTAIDQISQPVEKRTKKGEKRRLKLPDGSRVVLNAMSSIEYSADFGKQERHLEIHGEAYFEVAKDSNKPFQVRSNGIITTALGTSFNIKSYPEDSLVSISLAEGKVHLELPAETIGEEKSCILTPGEKLIYDKNLGRIAFEDIKIGYDLGWKDGLIVFEEAGFNEVINRLSLWYGIEFEIVNTAPLNWRYSGQFKDRTLEHVLDVISYIEEFDFQLNEDTIIIKFREANGK